MPQTVAITSFKSQPVKVNFSNIDKENGILRNVVLTEVGEASGHGVHLDDSFVASVITQGNNAGKIHARLGHPNACNTAMGTQIGYYTNFRMNENNAAIADLHLLEAAKAMPNGGNAWEWIFSMAKEAPEQIMNSIVFYPSGHYQVNDKGEREDLKTDDYGYPEVVYENQPVYVELGELLKSDLVEDGAATSSLFSKENTHLFATTGDQFLADNPALLRFLQNNPNRLIEYAQKHGIEIGKKGLIEQIKSLFSNAAIDTSEFDRLVIDNQQLTAQLAAVKETSLAFAGEVKQLKAEAEILTKDLTALQSYKVQAIAKIKELTEALNDVDVSNFRRKTDNTNLNNKPIWHKDNF